MKVYHKIILQTNKNILDIKSDKIHIINIYNINNLSEYIGLFYTNNAKYKFVIDEQTNYVHMISFDNVFENDYKEFEQFKNAIPISNEKIEQLELDCIIKNEKDKYYTYIDDDYTKYIIEYQTYDTPYSRNSIMLASEWYVRKEEDEEAIHILSIYRNYKCDEDEGEINKKASQKYCNVLHKILKYEEDKCSDFYTYYCHMNTCNKWRW
jgi:hypothetical protein